MAMDLLRMKGILVSLLAVGASLLASCGGGGSTVVEPARTLSLVAGSLKRPSADDGVGEAAGFNLPEGVALDAAGNVYVADTGNHIVRKLSADGAVTTIAGTAGQSGGADGTGASARF